KVFLSKVGKGRTIAEYSKNEVVFAQGDQAETVFYIQHGKVKLTVVSNAGKEAVIAIWAPATFWARVPWPAGRCAWLRPPQCRIARSYDWRKRPRSACSTRS